MYKNVKLLIKLSKLYSEGMLWITKLKRQLRCLASTFVCKGKTINLTQLQLSKELVVHESTISNWENGLREPNLNTLIIISQYFDVSID